MSEKGVHAHAKLIDDVGGPAKVAKRYGLKMQAVSQWKTRGIPHRYRPDFMAFAGALGVTTPRDFLQLTRGAV